MESMKQTINANRKYTLLSLGDSYTIGEAVPQEDSFPFQTVNLLAERKIIFQKPKIIAVTGWTTDELQNAIREAELSETFDFVTLLIGVNNQYRNRDLDNYKKEFSELLQTAIAFADNNRKNVIVISIPDWGVTPFAEKDERGQLNISQAIDKFNTLNKTVSEEEGIHYIDITPHSRLAKKDISLIASDGLHPSGKMYAFWAGKVAEYIEKSAYIP